MKKEEKIEAGKRLLPKKILEAFSECKRLREENKFLKNKIAEKFKTLPALKNAYDLLKQERKEYFSAQALIQDLKGKLFFLEIVSSNLRKERDLALNACEIYKEEAKQLRIASYTDQENLPLISPFTRIFNSRILESSSEEEIQTALKRARKGLATIFHPDGNPLVANNFSQELAKANAFLDALEKGVTEIYA